MISVLSIVDNSHQKALKNNDGPGCNACRSTKVMTINFA